MDILGISIEKLLGASIAFSSPRECRQDPPVEEGIISNVRAGVKRLQFITEAGKVFALDTTNAKFKVTERMLLITTEVSEVIIFFPGKEDGSWNQ